MKIDKTEASGKGINTIVENYGIEVFEFSESYLSIKIPYNKKVLNSINFHSGENVGVKMNENVGVKVNEIQKMIYTFIRNDSKITYAELSKYTNKSEETIRRNIKKLVNMKLIERVGSDKNGQWKIKDK